MVRQTRTYVTIFFTFDGFIFCYFFSILVKGEYFFIPAASANSNIFIDYFLFINFRLQLFLLLLHP